ncbi:MAG: aminotransferase class III-fold pyridoxal phosphate-dependent enzyme [Calditerrivibrio sp.]|nr:aminotransferase class III-fold pyridoxal phosphate-dependent enzyme [Calditerrivibrio sp.]
MEKIFKEYTERFKKSLDIFNINKDLFPKGVNHDIRFYKPFPIVVSKGSGSKIYTVDDIEILDIWMGHYANILGHCNPSAREAINKVTGDMLQMGILHRWQGELGELIKEAVPEMELMRFCTSGTEATMYVTRVAKRFTGRDIVAKIEGGWHGGNTDLSFDVKPPYSRFKDGVISLPFNDVEKTIEILDRFKMKIAAIILEPILGAGGGIKVENEYLKTIRKYCDENGTLLIYDETITGFRFRYGSIYPIIGIKPDLFTMGKIIGGGFAIGLYGGRRDVMSIIQNGDIITGGGTFSAHPVTMAAGIATLKVLKGADYSKLNEMGDKLRDRVSNLFSKTDIKAFVSGFGSMIAIHFYNSENINRICPSTFLGDIDSEKENLFKILMILNGVYTMHSGGAISFAHSVDDIEKIYNAYKYSLERMENE